MPLALSRIVQVFLTPVLRERADAARLEARSMRGCRIALLLVVTTLVSAPAFAQTTSSLRGKIVDAQGAMLPGVLLQLISAQTAFARNVITDETGAYQFPQIPPGAYELMAQLEGFAEVKQKV